MQFTHLFIETNYAMNGSNIRINELVKLAVQYQYSFLSIADPRMYGTIKFYKECIKHGIKPLLGLQIELEGLQQDKTNKVLLYAKNNIGYQHLLSLASFSSHHPVTLRELKKHKQGIIGIVLSDESELYKAYQNHQNNVIGEFKQLLKTHLEHAYVSISKDPQFNLDLQKEFSFVVVPKVGYLKAEDKKVSDVLKKIFDKKSDELLGVTTDQYFLSPEEVIKTNKNYPDALERTMEIANMCNVTIDFGIQHLPSYPLQNKVSSKDYLRALAEKGLQKRLVGRKVDKETYEKRLHYELNVIDSMGYNDYFLIVWDFVKYAKQQRYLVGPGRGSAAASLVSYCLGITNVDSLEFNLVFERFLNPERITLPDIDMDLPDDKRDDIISYVRDFYGMNRVSSICTFGTFLSKSAIRDTARILEIEGILLNEIIKETPQYNTIEEMMEQSLSIQNIMNQQPQVQELLQIASRIEGLHRHVSTHAAGIIVTEDIMTNHTAVQPGLLDMFQTQYEAKDLEDLGLLKIDFLGLRNLTSIDKIIDLIETQEGKRIDIYKIPLTNKKTFDLLKRVETTGIFQLESKGMRSLIGQMQIDSFEDIVTILALFRPGPMENIPSYIKRRNKEEEVTYPHKVIEDILRLTNGIIIYQEQIIQIAALFAGYSLGEADLLRRAVSKKQESVLMKERTHFIEKARLMGRDDATSNEIYDYIVKFANYGFNRAHSVAYAMVSYWMAYLKANYPKYFISILTTSVIGSESQMRDYIFEANKLGVQIVKPSVNYSTDIFLPDGDTLRYPLLGIKNVGSTTVRDLLEERQNGVYLSFYDFVKRTQKVLNKRVLESLILAGALDEFHHSKRSMVEQLEEVINFTLYGDFIDQNEFVLAELPEYDYDVLEEKEKSVLGFNLFVNPLHNFSDYINKHNLKLPSTITENDVNQEVKFVAILSSKRTITTKQQKQMAFCTLQDEFVKLNGVLFSNTYNQYKDILTKNTVFLCKGKVEERGNERQVVLSHMHPLT